MSISFKKLILLLAALAVLLAAARAVAAETPIVATIMLQDSGFSPEEITVADGTTVTWINQGTKQHELNFHTDAIKKPLISPGESWSRTFYVPDGHESWHFGCDCEKHYWEHGKVTVTKAGAG